MKALAILILFLAASPRAQASLVRCADKDNSAVVTAHFDDKNKNSPPTALTLSSGGKIKSIPIKDVTRFVRDQTHYYLLFKVAAKSGAQEVELNTRIVKSAANVMSSAGFLTNKGSNDKLEVVCKF